MLLALLAVVPLTFDRVRYRGGPDRADRDDVQDMLDLAKRGADAQVEMMMQRAPC